MYGVPSTFELVNLAKPYRTIVAHVVPSMYVVIMSGSAYVPICISLSPNTITNLVELSNGATNK